MIISALIFFFFLLIFLQCKTELAKLVAEDKMAGIPVLIFANKQDLLSSKPAEVRCFTFEKCSKNISFFTFYFRHISDNIDICYFFPSTLNYFLIFAGGCGRVERYT
jgi:hypothetical protein